MILIASSVHQWKYSRRDTLRHLCASVNFCFRNESPRLNTSSINFDIITFFLTVSLNFSLMQRFSPCSVHMGLLYFSINDNELFQNYTISFHVIKFITISHKAYLTYLSKTLCKNWKLYLSSFHFTKNKFHLCKWNNLRSLYCISKSLLYAII